MLPVLGSVRSGLRGTDVAAVTQHAVFVPAEILYFGMSNVKMKGGSCMSHATSNIPTPHPHLSQTVAQNLGCLVWDIAAYYKKKRPCLPGTFLLQETGVHKAVFPRSRGTPCQSNSFEDQGDSSADQTKEPLNCFNRLIDQWSIKVSMWARQSVWNEAFVSVQHRGIVKINRVR